MRIRTVGVMMPGDMGHALGRVLREGGMRVITCLRGRGPRTIALAAAAGIVDVEDDRTLVLESDLILAILAPTHARALADRIAAALQATGVDLLYADCNAISPQSAVEIGGVLGSIGARYVDAGIVGGPPRPGAPGPRLYASGTEAGTLLQLREYGVDVRIAGAEIGQASGLKMCYASLTKGLTALATEALVVGRQLGVDQTLRAELQASQGELLAWIDQSLPAMPPKAWRWIGEMEEIAATFAAAGLPPEMLAGAAALYRMVRDLPLCSDAPDNGGAGTPADALAEQFAQVLQQRKAIRPSGAH